MKIKLYESQNDLIVKLNSIAVALMIVSSCIIGVAARINILASLQNNVIVLGLVFICVLLNFFISKKIRLPIATLFIFGWVSIMYIVTLFFHSTHYDLTLIQFIFYAIIPIYLISQEVDGEYVMRYSLYISLITLPVINSFFVIQYEKYSQAYMGNIYAILSPVIIALIHFKLYRKQANIVTKIAYIYNLYVLLKMLAYANRGAILCIVFCVMVLLINSYDGYERKKLPPAKIILIVTICIVAFLAVIFALPIMEEISAICRDFFNNVPSFITKSIRYLKEGNLSNGRDNISDFTINAILEKPFFGHGIETFQSYAESTIGKSWPYPHQYMLQFIFESGIVLSIIPIFLSIYMIIKVVFCGIQEKKEFALCCTLVCINIPKLLFSTDIWASTGIWMLITYSLIYIFRKNNYFSSLQGRSGYNIRRENNGI